MIFKDKEIMEKLNKLETQINYILRDVEYLCQELGVYEPIAVAENAPFDEPTEKWERYYHKGEITNVEVSTLGNVRDANTKMLLEPKLNATGKPRVSFGTESGISTNALVCNMIVRTFIDPNLPIRASRVHHLDGDEFNNRVDNLSTEKSDRYPWGSREDTSQQTDNTVSTWCKGEEIWTRFYRENYPTNVEVSNYGNLRLLESKKPVSIQLNEAGTPRFMYWWTENGTKKSSSATVSNAVATMFMDRQLPLSFKGVHHIDENPMNNHVDNLVIR